MKRFLLAIILVLCAGQAWGATYYVKNGGNNNLAGTAPATAWANHPWDTNSTGTASGTVLAGDDIVYMRCGDTWYATGFAYWTCNDAGTSGHQITTTSDCATFYAVSASDSQPIISGALNPATLTWAADGGSYKAQTPDVTIRMVMYNGVILTPNDGATNGVGANQWDYVDEGANGRIYVNVGEDPTGGVPLIHIAGAVLNSTGDYQTFSNLIVQNSGSNASGMIVTGVTGTVYDNITARYFLNHGFLANSSTSTEIKNSRVYSSKTIGNANNIGIYALTSTSPSIHDNEVYNLISYGINIEGGTGGTAYLNTVHDTGLAGISVKGTHQVYRNTIHDIWNGVYYGGGTSTGYGINATSTSDATLVYRNYIYDCVEGIRDTTSGTGGNKYYYNLIVNSKTNSIDIGNSSVTNHSEFYNNTIYHNPDSHNDPTYTGHGIAVQGGAAKKAKLANNLIIVNQEADTCQGIFIHDTAADVSEVLTDYNLIYLQNGATNIANIDNTNYKSLADWKTAAQANATIKNLAGTSNLAAANDKASNPSIISATDYHLGGGSPAINAGVVVSGVHPGTDFAGNPNYKGAAPDIGAYEKSLGGLMAPFTKFNIFAPHRRLH